MECMGICRKLRQRGRIYSILAGYPGNGHRKSCQGFCQNEKENQEILNMKSKIKNGEWWIGDCLELMKDIESDSIDMILCDLPYGTTQNKWDSIIPFEPLWDQYWRIGKPNAAIVLTAQCPFDKILGASQIKHLKYEWIYQKSKATGFLNAKKQPLKNHENVLVFYKKQCVYNPQIYDKENLKIRKPTKTVKSNGSYGNYKEGIFRTIPKEKGYPLSIQKFSDPFHARENGFHPTQKPVKLFEYLIKTYTNEGDLVLDNCAGSGTTAVAAEQTDRRWICIEQDEEYSKKAIKRIQSIKRLDLI